MSVTPHVTTIMVAAMTTHLVNFRLVCVGGGGFCQYGKHFQTNCKRTVRYITGTVTDIEILVFILLLHRDRDQSLL